MANLGRGVLKLAARLPLIQLKALKPLSILVAMCLAGLILDHRVFFSFALPLDKVDLLSPKIADSNPPRSAVEHQDGTG